MANATIGLLGIVYDTKEDVGGIDLTVEFETARLRLVNFPYSVTGYRSGPLGHREIRNPMPEETLRDETFSGKILLEEPLRNGSYRFLPQDERSTVDLPWNGDVSLATSPPRLFNGWNNPDFMGLLHQRSNRPLYPVGSGAELQLGNHSEWNFRDSLVLLLFGGDFVLENRKGGQTAVLTGERLNMSRTVADPSGTYGTWHYDRAVLLVEGVDVAVRLHSSDPYRLQLVAQKLEGFWSGDFEFSGVQGTINVDDSSLPSRQQMLQLVGTFEARNDYADSQSQWEVGGEATFVAVDGLPVLGRRSAPLSDLLPPVVATTTALALLLVIIRTLPELLGIFYSRLAPERVLLHPVRFHLVQIVESRPGVILRDVVAITGRPYGVIRHHARILKTAGKLKILNRGKATHLYPPEHSLAVAKRELVLLADAPARFLIEKLESGVLPQAVLVAELRRTFGFGRASAWKAVQRAVDTRLIERIRLDGSFNLRLTRAGTP